MLKEKTDFFLPIAVAMLFVFLVIYLVVQDSAAVGPL